jgi:hypothetical protein
VTYPICFAALLSLCAAALPAADLSGRYSGSVVMTTPEGERTRPMALVIDQSADKILVTVGPNATQLHPASNVKLDGDRMTFDLIPPGETRVAMKFDVRVDVNTLEGTQTVLPPNREPRVGKLTLKKQIE